MTGPSDEEMDAAVIGGPTLHDGPIHLAEIMARAEARSRCVSTYPSATDKC